MTDTNADWTFFALYQEIAKEHARMHARRAIVTRIEESDFGCEGRPDGVIAMDHVYLRYEQESEEFCLMAEDDQLYADHIDENSTVLVTADGKNSAAVNTAVKMNPLVYLWLFFHINNQFHTRGFLCLFFRSKKQLSHSCF